MHLPPQAALAERHGPAQKSGAGEGNRTLVVSLGSFCSAIELHPHRADSLGPGLGSWQRRVPPAAGTDGPGKQRQNPAPTLANTIAWLPPFWPLLTLAPMSASMPNKRVRAPKVSVIQDWSYSTPGTA